MDHRNFKFTFDAALQFAIAGFLVSLTAVMILFGFLPTLLQDVSFKEAAANVGAHAALGVVAVGALMKLPRRFTWLWQFDAAIVLAVLGVLTAGTHWYGSYVASITNVAVFLSFFGLAVRSVVLFVIAINLADPEDEVVNDRIAVPTSEASAKKEAPVAPSVSDDLARL